MRNKTFFGRFLLYFLNALFLFLLVANLVFFRQTLEFNKPDPSIVQSPNRHYKYCEAASQFRPKAATADKICSFDVV